jgi:pimeloyl-ACP methyl ester carboxylesterase
LREACDPGPGAGYGWQRAKKFVTPCCWSGRPHPDRDINGLIAGSDLIVMPGVGHIPQLQEPAGFAAILGKTLVKMAR